MIRKLAKGVGILLGVVVLLLAGFVGFESNAYARSMAKVYDVPPPALERSTDSAVIARGKHLAEAVAGCAGGDCHGADLGGGNTIEAGPIGSFSAPNITQGGVGANYSDQELARVILHGIKKDGRSVRFMPSQDF